MLVLLLGRPQALQRVSLSLITCGVTLALIAAPHALAQDPWAPGSSAPGWQKIGTLQRCPFPQADAAPDWGAACESNDPLIRAAACMALGRMGLADHLPLLIARLEDETPLVRHSALAALLSIESPQIKEPLLNVIGTWAELRPPPFYQQQVTWSLQRHGLPGWLTDSNTSLAARQQWLAEFDSAAWKLTFQNSHHDFTWDDGQTRVWIAVPDGEIDADEPIRLQVRIQRRGGRRASKAYLHRESGRMLEVDRAGEILRRDGGQAQFTFAPAANSEAKEFVVDLPPDQTVKVEAVARPRREVLVPGIYQLYAFHAEWPLFIRIRRSRDMEAAVPGLLEKLPEPKAVQSLGQQRVKAAVPRLVEEFSANANKNNFAVARALARIGDPAAIPVLLKYPAMVDYDLLGSTEGDLATFGVTAHPYFEQAILDWRAALAAKDTSALVIALRLVGAKGSKEVDVARMELIQHLSQTLTLDRERRNYRELAVLTAALRSAAPAHPREITDAIWATRDRPQVFDGVLNDLRLAEDLTNWKPTIVELYRRSLQPGAEQVSRERLNGLAMSVAPELVLAERDAIASAADAQRVLYRGMYHEPTWANSMERIRDFLGREPDPGVQVALGYALFRRGAQAECEQLLRAALSNQQITDDDKVTTHYYLGSVLLARGRAAEGRREWEAALALAQPNRSYGIGSLTAQRMRRDLTEAAAIPDMDPLVRSQHRMTAAPELNGRIESGHGCAFFIDQSRRLHRWDPQTKTKATFGVLPNPVRQIIPVDRGRVFVLFQDGTSQLYREGQRKAAWDGPAEISYYSYLTASPALITAADVHGVLMGIDPDTGQILWKRKSAQPFTDETPEARSEKPEQDPFDPSILVAEPIAKTNFKLSTWSGLTGQVGPLVLIPDQPLTATGLDCVKIQDGVTRARIKAGFEITELAACRDLAILIGPRGEVAAASLSDGKRRWQTQIENAGDYSEFESCAAVNEDGKVCYVAIKDQLWGLDGESGKVVWKWTLKPKNAEPRGALRGGPYSQLLAVPDGVVWIVNWLAEPRRDRRDIVKLSATGEVPLHETSPLQFSLYAVNGPFGFVEGKSLFVNYGQDWESWLLPIARK